MPGASIASSRLTPVERVRLANILARLASPFEGERAAAALLATAFVQRHGLAWSDLAFPQAGVSEPSPAEPPQERRHGTTRPWRGYCRRRKAQAGAILSRLA